MHMAKRDEQVEEYSDPEQPKASTPVEYVKYVGTSHEREITEGEWKAVGVDHAGLMWNASNNWMVPRDQVSAEAWPYIDADSGFLVVDQDGNDTKATKGESPSGLVQLNTGAPPGGASGASSEYTGSGTSAAGTGSG
jgi:hypothetical protein